MKLLTELLKLNERQLTGKIVDRRVLQKIEKALKALGPGVKLIKASESSDSVEGEGTVKKPPNASAIKRAEKDLESLGFDEFLQSGDFLGMTVMGAEIEVFPATFQGKPSTFGFFIEFDQR